MLHPRVLRAISLAAASILLVSLLGTPANAADVSAPGGLSPTGPVASTTPSLSWTAVSRAVAYEVQADDSYNFDSPLLSLTTVNTVVVPTSHLPVGDISWRVRSVTESGARSPWSTVDLSVEPTAPPTPEFPVAGQQLSQPDEPPMYTWSPVPGAVGYDVEVDVDGDWIASTPYSATGTSFLAPAPQAAGPWFWRVRARLDGGQVTHWSDSASYSVAALAAVQIDPNMPTGASGTDRGRRARLAAGSRRDEVRGPGGPRPGLLQRGRDPRGVQHPLLPHDQLQQRPVLLAGASDRHGRDQDGLAGGALRVPAELVAMSPRCCTRPTRWHRPPATTSTTSGPPSSMRRCTSCRWAPTRTSRRAPSPCARPRAPPSRPASEKRSAACLRRAW